MNIFSRKSSIIFFFTYFTETQQVILDSNTLKKESPHFLLDVQLLTLFPVCGLITCNAHCGTVMEEEKKRLLLLRRLGDRVGCYLYNCFAPGAKKCFNPGYFTVEAGVFMHLSQNSWVLFSTGVRIIHIGVFIL